LQQTHGWDFDFSNPVVYLRQAIESLTVNHVFGMKTNWRQFKTFMGILREIVGKEGEAFTDFELIEVFFPDIKYLFLKRRNKIKQAISFSKGMQTGIWKATPEELKIYQDYVLPPRYDRFHIECCLDEILAMDEGWEQFLASYPGEYMKIWYEDLAEEFTKGMLEIYKYLGVDPNLKEPEPVTKKLANKQSEDWYQKFTNETDWLENKQLHQALISGDTRKALILRAEKVFFDKGQNHWFRMPVNRNKKLKYYLFRLNKKVSKFLKK
ncbi:MAG: Stf0 family sulfotransferase, partial [Anaerolineales bacterium]